MNESEKKGFGDTDLGTCIGVALIILALCLGVGACNAIQAVALCNHDEQAEGVTPDAKAQTEAIAVDAMTTIAIEASEL